MSAPARQGAQPPDRQRPHPPARDDRQPVARPPQQPAVPEIGGPPGLEPTRYGDWEKGGRCSDF
jgi:hypothetical protein